MNEQSEVIDDKTLVVQRLENDMVRVTHSPDIDFVATVSDCMRHGWELAIKKQKIIKELTQRIAELESQSVNVREISSNAWDQAMDSYTSLLMEDDWVLKHTQAKAEYLATLTQGNKGDIE